MSRCDSSSCYCSDVPVRKCPSLLGQQYTVEALPFVGAPWLFRYVYL